MKKAVSVAIGLNLIKKMATRVKVPGTQYAVQKMEYQT